MLGGYGRGRGMPQGAGFYKNNFALNDYGDEDDLNDYDEYYPESDEVDNDPQFIQNYPPGAMFAGGPPKLGQSALTGGYPGGVNSTSGVPFYGQQNKMGGGMPLTYGAASQFGGGFGAGQAPFGQAALGAGPSGGGGFTYGMASKGGNLFGPPAGGNTFGEPLFPGQQAKSDPLSAGIGAGSNKTGLMQFGSISQFGGLGSGGTTFGAGTSSLFGGAAAGVAVDDPYANIALDLNKVKKAEPPPKLYEHKTEEEKKKDAETASKTAAATKSSLKKDTAEEKPTATTKKAAADDDDDDKNKKKRNVTFGKSTTYEVERGETDESGEYYNKDVHLDGTKGSPRPGSESKSSGKDKKVIAEKDLSDGRSEKEKILEMLEKKQREQLEEIKEMNEWKSKVEDKKPSGVEDSVGESSSSNANPNLLQVKKTAIAQDKSEHSNSYESDDFEDVSASGSGSKQKITYWPGKDQFKKTEEAAASLKDNKNKEESDEYDPKAMEEYLKKQQQQSKTQTTSAAASKPVALSSNYDHSESSDKYDDDFESLSKSQSAMPPVTATKPQSQQPQKSTFEYKPQPSSQQAANVTADFKSPLEKYIKKENKFIQTDEGKYSYLGPTDQTTSSYKEWTLQQNLKDAENLIQDLKNSQAENKEKIKDLETQLKKKDVEYQTMRREALNATETQKRLQEQLKDAVHKNNLYKIETEELIKQIDLADAKTREKEDEVKLVQAEFERKLKLQEERILFRRSKQEERDTYEIKRQHMLEREELQKKLEDQKEEIDYYMQKVTKIEVENKSLRLGKDSNKRIKELEDEIDNLKFQLSTTNQKIEKENINLKNIQKELSKEDQVKLQRELQQLEIMVRGYQEENEKAVLRQKQLEKDLKTNQEKLNAESRKVKELQQKALLGNEKVYVEEKTQELDIQTVNTMGNANAITQKQLQEMHQQLQKLQTEKFDYERDFSLREGHLKAQINKVRDDKATIEKQLLETEFLVGDKDREIQKLKDEFMQQKQQLTDQVQELEDKVAFFRQNQKLLTEDEDSRQESLRELVMLREKTKKLEEENRRAKDLEKKCKLLEETIKSKNPNSIPMMLQAVKETAQQEKQGDRQLLEKIKQLEFQLEDKDKEYEKKLRTLRQEQERIKEMYEKKKGQTPEAKRIQELEDELQNTKNYYNKRIREIEDKYKFGKVTQETKGLKEQKLNKKPPTPAAGSAAQKQQEQPVNQAADLEAKQHYEEMIDKLTKERNFLAQKVVNMETQNNRRRQSLQGSQLISAVQEEAQAIYSNLNQIIQGIKQQSGTKDAVLNLIGQAVTFVEQLKTRDPAKNKKLSEIFLQLTQELSTTNRVNVKLVDDALNICKNEMMAESGGDLKVKRMNSECVPQHQTLNKDLSGVINFYPEEQKVTRSPIQDQQFKSQSFVNPFATQKDQVQTASPPLQGGKRVKEIVKSIVQSGIDLEKIVEERGLNANRVPLNQLYQLLREDPMLKTISLEEVKQLNQFVKEKSGIVSENMMGREEIDIHDLINVVMDVSLDIFGQDEHMKVTDSFLGQPTRYSQEIKKQEQPRAHDRNPKLEADLQQMKQKTDRMQKIINDMTYEKRELQDKVDKLEQAKGRMEKILKQQLGGRSFKKAGTGDFDSTELVDELSVIMKRIEFLEQQSDERSKQSMMEHEPCKREIQRLYQELEAERSDKLRLLAKKNSEVAYFKAELDSLLSEIKNTAALKQRRSSQHNSQQF